MNRLALLLTLIITLIFSCSSRMPSSYNDHYARHKVCPFTGMSDTDNITYINNRLNHCFYNATFLTHVLTSCDIFNKNPNITCAGSAFIVHDEQAIVLLYRWTVEDANGDEGTEEFHFYNMTVAFPGGGTVSQFYFNAFQQVWKNGIRDAFFSAKNANPTYEVWVTGGSMGASMAAMSAAYISQMGYVSPNDIKMINFGELRIGHKDFADRYPTLVPYAYRIVHRNDIAPHAIPLTAGYSHHKNEIWYNNSMNENDPYIECDEEESPNCSDSVPQSEWTWNDHKYFVGAGLNDTCYCMKGSR